MEKISLKLRKENHPKMKHVEGVRSESTKFLYLFSIESYPLVIHSEFSH